ncbi:XrtA/PEP-CTERM system histidine kinase PrsK [Parahaliea mediterranea]|uniref:histidine kinase n=1 Tax=Parahaliea mediterranea TaxID=651086 RepID=A0A939DFR7_9GAMM|nr:XrtA/PEP-CTERM system histidine kinase PrsK [Parahaliea mediterranea]MBN7797465.1 PEP-CTERM system histidine kinase PrsK [Parahaliea mediterranea]
MPTNVGLYSYLAACVTFGALALLLMFAGRQRPYAALLIVANALTALWAGVIAFGTLADYPPVTLMQLAELARNAAWLFLLLRLTAAQFAEVSSLLAGRRWLYLFIAGAVAALLLLTLPSRLEDVVPPLGRAASAIGLGTWLAIAVAGLLLIEQLFRNASESERWSMKYLCLGLTCLFGYDFFLYAEGLLFQQLDPNLWQARGLVSTVAAPLLAVAIARNSDWQSTLHVSRHVVFHSVTLVAAGLYLMAMSVVGYFIRLMDGTWGGVLQTSFMVAAGAMLLVLLFSGKLRAHARVLLNKHFFSYKYDYREEWLNFTRALADIGDDVPEGIVRTMVPLVGSQAGLLFAIEGGRYNLLANYQMPAPEGDFDMGELPAWLEQSEWVVDLDEWDASPDMYNHLELPAWLQRVSQPWLIVPLIFGTRLAGILVIRRSDLQQGINWEERDLLKTAGRQAASHLAQFLAQKALVEARQFDAFNRLSAYVIHDLKNILAQQSLMVANAEKHKDNPAFVDDMIETVRNSVTRMTRLMDQMRSGMRDSQLELLDLADVLRTVVEGRAGQRPAPSLEVVDANLRLQADRERLATVFNHLVQNAQEACDKRGEVQVAASRDHGFAVVTIRDTGRGMDADFIANRLFTPFDSTKGLTGMGIGAFESRDYIRGIGGDIRVESEPGVGSTFRVYLPIPQDKENVAA